MASDEEFDALDQSSYWDDPTNFFGSVNLPQPSSFPTANELSSRARQCANNILAKWQVLHGWLERYEETIRKRWSKKTKEQRKRLLLAAWPEMLRQHRPDFEALRRETLQQRQAGTGFKDAYLMPYVNLEDLSKGKTLLLFLNARGRNLPHVFAHADSDGWRLGFTSGAVRPPFLNCYTMEMIGKTTPDEYGRLVSWDDDENAFDWLHSGYGMHPGHGLQVLEIQQQVLSFLVKCCEQVMHDLPPTVHNDASIPVQPEPPSITVAVDEAGYASLASLAAEAPYRVPAQLDFRRLRAIIAAKHSAAEDHVWALREDPGYFADTVGDWSEHRQEKLLDTFGQRHPILDRPLFWDRVIGNVIVDAYSWVMLWDIMLQQVERLANLQEKYSEVISPTEKLPAEYMEAILDFRHLLDQAAKGPIGNLKTGVPASPPLRSCWVREPQVPGTNKIRVFARGGSGTDQLLWLFEQLFDDQKCHLCGLPNLMDELERLTQSDKIQKQRISFWIARVISDLAVIAEATNQINLYYPWAAVFEQEDADHGEEIRARFSKSMSQLARFHSATKDIPLARLGEPSEGRFYYPADKRRTKQNTVAMQNAERNLDLFWSRFDQSFATKNGSALHNIIRQHVTTDRPLQRTSDWVEPTREPKQLVREEPDAVPYRAFSRLDLDDGVASSTRKGHENDMYNLPPKAKVKTRGTPHTDGRPTELEPLERHMPDVQPTFAVSKRALKVFSTLFHTPNQSGEPGELPWLDFLHAMESVGFAPQKLYGSVWQFTPTKLDVERSIQFHEPHPHSRIPYRVARRFGRRLDRAYGWHGGMFILE